jgi:predicted SAM-dependent methyltransferase
MKNLVKMWARISLKSLFNKCEKKDIFVKYNKIDEVLENEHVLKLHIGCGTVYKDGWINIDNNSDDNIKKLDFSWDLRNKLPFPNNSVDFIYNEHFLEHLTVEEGLAALKNFRDILKPGGVMRIAMPDLADVISNYLNVNWKIDQKYFLKKYNLEFIQTRAERINISFRWWGHKWLYDWEELHRRLLEAGFSRITKCNLYESKFSELCKLETRPESRLIAEVIK